MDKKSKRIKIGRSDEWKVVNMSNWHNRRKLQEETENNRKIEEQRLEKERIDNIHCPVCKSTNKHHHIKRESNGIMGPGHSSWMTENFLICKDCGVHYNDLKSFKE
jgi:transposase-like protein